MQPLSAVNHTANYDVLAPGPVNLHPLVLETLSLPMIHHRTPEFDAILQRALLKLKNIFKTTQPAYILSSTGSGGMEALLVNLLSPGDKVLAIDSGKFGERWCEMATTYGANLHTIKVPWGESVQVGKISQFLQENPDTKLVLCQACETSTGVAHPIREIAEQIRNYEGTLFLVDAITALGAMPLPMDEWGIDGIVGGSQKAFMLPTGLSFVALSEKAWKVAKTAKCPRFYFDLRKEQKANEKGETFFSSNVSLIRALEKVLDLIEQTGFSAHLENIANRANFVRHFAKDLGLQLFAHAPSNSITALRVPEGFDSQKIRGLLESKYRITIMGGQDQAKGKILRIGHMGYITWESMQQLMLSLHDCMKELQPGFAFPKTRDQLALEMRAWVVHVKN